MSAASKDSRSKVVKSVERRRTRGSGGILQVGDRVWRVDVELPRDPVTGRRRRVSRTVRGSPKDAELALARLKVAGHERRLPSGGTNARSVSAAMELYQTTAESGSLELAPRTVTTSRSAIKVMGSMELPDGRKFGAIPLSRLTWQDVEHLYGAMRASGRGPDWIRRCATVLTPRARARPQAGTDRCQSLQGRSTTEIDTDEAVRASRG